MSTWRLVYDSLDTSFVYVVRVVNGGCIARQFFDSDRSDTQTARSTTQWLLPSHKVVRGLISPAIERKKRVILRTATHFLKLKDNPFRAPDVLFLMNVMSNFYVLDPLLDARRGVYIHYSCFCLEFSKHFSCHHSLAKGIKDRIVNILLDLSFQTLGKKKRARRRIANAFLALIRQPKDSSSRGGRGFTSSQTDDSCCFLRGATNTAKYNKIVFCDGCDAGFHKKCLVPYLTKILDGYWYCLEECECMGLSLAEQ